MKYLSDRSKRGGIRAFATLADQSIASATNFLSGVIIGRGCAREEFGLYMLGFSILLFVLSAQYSLISMPYTMYCPRCEDGEKWRYTGSTLIFLFLICLIVSCGLLAVDGVLSLNGWHKELKEVLWALAAAITFIMLKEYIRQVCFALLRIRRVLLLDCFIAIVQIGGLLLLFHFQITSASVAFLVIGVSCAVVSIPLLVGTRKDFEFTLPQIGSDFRRNWRLAKWMFPATLTGMFSQQIYPWLLTNFRGIAATGALAACMGVIYLANPFMVGMANYLAPKTAHGFAHGGVREMKDVIKKASAVIATAMILFCALMAIFGERFLILIYGSKYAKNGLAVLILAFGQLAQSLAMPLNYGLLAMERADVEFKSYLLALCFLFSAGLWLIKSFGIFGVAYSYLGSNMIASVYRWIVFRKYVMANSVEIVSMNDRAR